MWILLLPTCAPSAGAYRTASIPARRAAVHRRERSAERDADERREGARDERRAEVDRVGDARRATIAAMPPSPIASPIASPEASPTRRGR